MAKVCDQRGDRPRFEYRGKCVGDKKVRASLYGRFAIGGLCPLGVALPPDSSRLQRKTTLPACRIYPALNYTDGRARVDEGSSVVRRFTGLLSSHPILITSNVHALFMQRIVVAATLRKSCPASINGVTFTLDLVERPSLSLSITPPL